MSTRSFRNDKGAALIEFCIILPLLIVMVFAIIDFGRLIQARLIITNVTREGGNLASRDIKSGNDLIAMLQSSASSLDSTCGSNPLNQCGRIYISTIEAGLTQAKPNPVVSTQHPQVSAGNLVVPSGIKAGATNLGLTKKLYDHMVFKPANQTADINGVTVVETFYKYKPITPLPRFITNILLNDGDGTIIGSRAVFCTTGG
jgi:Flp pilus assembly protein TadG